MEHRALRGVRDCFNKRGSGLILEFRFFENEDDDAHESNLKHALTPRNVTVHLVADSGFGKNRKTGKRIGKFVLHFTAKHPGFGYRNGLAHAIPLFSGKQMPRV